MNYSDAVYARVVTDTNKEGATIYKVDMEMTHRDQAKMYLNELLAKKKANYAELVRILTQNRMNSHGTQEIKKLLKRMRKSSG